ncbi:ATP-grasp domain-containing protein [Dactylosporangium sp. AC04546]|uniref:preATP grasp domain-containing protein n=1 Tax=Dactylosporangium sp. AC04546 TaxID=2862460 RepID=UPI001EDF14FB|nr:ATP-grasp domain-containing protein [Dactylosporangium sp. AC04546]WVK81300.1 ATP-grasp domain-containing protein [Dactylosporangium sp. AC04546]
MPFLPRLKRATTGDAATPLVFVGNFEVEDRWAEGEPGLPRYAFGTSAAMVHRMDEFALLLAGGGDAVVLKAAPDPDHLDDLARLGLDLPRVLAAGDGDPARVVTADALADPVLLGRLRALAPGGARLLPHGVSALEEQLAEATGLGIAGSPAAVCKAVNSKIYSRRLADRLGLRQPDGWTCTTLQEWRAAAESARALLAAGRTVVVKDAFGVSGKGIMTVRDEPMLLRLDRKLHERAERRGDDRLTLVVETWVGKRADLNYQVTVGRDGTPRFDFVKEALTANGVHKGHRMPARLDAAQLVEVRAAAEAIGAALAADGYHGVAGVDALVGDDERLFPVIEINARSNMSTYQVRLQEACVPDGGAALARQYPLRLGRPVSYAELRGAIADLLPARAGGSGAIVNNFATVNAAAGEGGKPFDGRLYALLVAGTATEAEAIDEELTRRLAGLAERTTT